MLEMDALAQKKGNYFLLDRKISVAFLTYQ